MAIFKDAINKVKEANPIGGDLGKVYNTGLDVVGAPFVAGEKLFSGLLNRGGGGDGFSLTLAETPRDLAAVREHVERVKKMQQSPIEGVRQGAQIELDQLITDRDKAIADLQAQQGGRLENIKQKMLLTGSDQGAQNRLARSVGRQGETQAQAQRGTFERLASGIRADDITSQQLLRDQALMSLPQLGMLPAGIQADLNIKNAAMLNQANAAAARAAAARRSGFGQAIGAIGGGVIGGYFGGPPGAAAGSSIGGSVGGGLFS
jgi:hypothetical protein